MPESSSSTTESGRRQTVTSRVVADWVRDRIRRGQLVPGQRLVEADVTRATRASRSKVREAFQRLEAEGLLTIEEFRGASVRRITFDEVRQIYRARMVLEGLAAAEFAARGTDKAKKTLEALQTQLDEATKAADHDEFGRLNSAWHALIIEGSGNSYVRQFVARLTVPIHRLLFSTFYAAKRISDANADHSEITRAIVEGRADDAERAMREHIAGGLRAIAEIDARLYD